MSSVTLGSMIEPVKTVLVKWVKSFQLPILLQKIQDLADGRFIAFLLFKISNFRLKGNIDFETKPITLAEKINIIKLVCQSMEEYYENYLQSSNGRFGLNYVDICTGNQEEIIRMVIFLIGIFAQDHQMRPLIQKFAQTLSSEDKQLWITMVDHGCRLSKDSTKEEDSPIKKQKRLIRKLEIVEEQIEYYQEKNHQLQICLENEMDLNQKQKKKTEKIQKDYSQLIKKLQNLEFINEKLELELKLKISNQQHFNQRLNHQKSIMSEKIKELSNEKDKLQHSMNILIRKVERLKKVQEVNQEIKSINQAIKQQNEEIKIKNQNSREELRQIRQKYLQIQEQNQILKCEIEQLRTKFELTTFKYPNHSFNQNESPQRSINNYNTKDSLSFLKQTEHEQNKYFNFDFQMNGSRKNDSLAFTIRSNRSIYMINKQNDKQNRNQQNREIKTDMLSGVKEEKSFEMQNEAQLNNFWKYKQQKETEINLLCTTIIELQKSIQMYREELKIYKLREARSDTRMHTFMKKVNTMFS